MYDRLELDSTFDCNTTNFTLRGNSIVFNALYEYMKTFSSSPEHNICIRMSRTITLSTYDRLIKLIGEEFPSRQIRTRSNKSLAMMERVQEGKTVDSYIDEATLITIMGTSVMLYVGRSLDYFSADIYVGTDSEREKIEKIARTMAEEFEERKFVAAKHTFHMITHDGQSLDLIEYDVNKAKFSDFDINRQYNDDFVDVARHIEETLSAKTGGTGIVLLHGCPGSGKTTYLRHLISVLPKRVIYMPPDMAHQLGTPAFFNFIRNYAESVLIIEDGENILRKRMEESGTAPAISNLLNLSDGIMGDALNIQVVCTFNADITEIDNALLRPGRLIANHYFGPLSEEKTKALTKHVYGEDAEPKSKEMTVAEIYKMNDYHADNTKPKSARRMGFLS